MYSHTHNIKISKASRTLLSNNSFCSLRALKRRCRTALEGPYGGHEGRALRLRGPSAAQEYGAEPQKAPSHEGRASEEDVSWVVYLFTAHRRYRGTAGIVRWVSSPSGVGTAGVQTSDRRGADQHQPTMSGRQQSRAFGPSSAPGTMRRASSRWRANGSLWQPRGGRSGRLPACAPVGALPPPWRRSQRARSRLCRSGTA